MQMIPMMLRLQAVVMALAVCGAAALAQGMSDRPVIWDTPDGWLEIPFDESFERQYGRPLPVHFTLAVPSFEAGYRLNVRASPRGALAEVVYTDDAGRVIEWFDVLADRVILSDDAEVPRALAHFIETRVLASLPVAPDQLFFGTVAGFQGDFVDYVGRSPPIIGAPSIVRALALPGPDGRSFVILAGERSEASLPLGASDPGQSFLGVAAGNLAFTAYRDEAGALQGFVPRDSGTP